MPEGDRRCLSEERPIRHGEAAKLGESVAPRDVRDTSCCGSPPQRRTDQVQSPQPNIAACAHSEELCATYCQGPVWYANRCAELARAQLSVAMFRQDGLEPDHDACVTSPGGSMHRVRIRVGGGQAVDEGVEQIMLHGSDDFPMSDKLRLGLGETTGLCVQAREVHSRP